MPIPQYPSQDYSDAYRAFLESEEDDRRSQFRQLHRSYYSSGRKALQEYGYNPYGFNPFVSFVQSLAPIAYTVRPWEGRNDPNWSLEGSAKIGLDDYMRSFMTRGLTAGGQALPTPAQGAEILQTFVDAIKNMGKADAVPKSIMDFLAGYGDFEEGSQSEGLRMLLSAALMTRWGPEILNRFFQRGGMLDRLMAYWEDNLMQNGTEFLEYLYDWLY
jgi:hypothetical protein